MTRRDQIYKWCIYALGLFPIWVLDAFVLSRYPLLGITPTLLPLAVSAVAVLEGALPGSGFGLAVGLLWTLAYPGSSSLLVFGMALAGFLWSLCWMPLVYLIFRSIFRRVGGTRLA